jgi:hypothetical protein
MNAISNVNQGNSVAVPGFDPFAAYGQEAASGGANFLKFAKGEWLLGQNGDEQPLGRKLVANMNELAIGWIRWTDGKPQERRMGLLASGFRPETRDALGYTDQELWDTGDDGKAVDPWTFTNELPLADPDTGEQMVFSASSKGGIGGIGNLCKSYSKERRSRGDQVPVIELQRDSYMHPVYKKLYVPVLAIVDWRDNMPDASPVVAEPEAAPVKEGKTRF